MTAGLLLLLLLLLLSRDELHRFLPERARWWTRRGAWKEGAPCDPAGDGVSLWDWVCVGVVWQVRG